MIGDDRGDCVPKDNDAHWYSDECKPRHQASSRSNCSAPRGHACKASDCPPRRHARAAFIVLLKLGLVRNASSTPCIVASFNCFNVPCDGVPPPSSVTC